MSRNPIRNLRDRIDSAKDSRIELLASMDRSQRREFYKAERRTKLRIFGIVAITAGGAYALGRYRNAKIALDAAHVNAIDAIDAVDAVKDMSAEIDISPELPTETPADIIFTEAANVKEAMV